MTRLTLALAVALFALACNSASNTPKPQPNTTAHVADTVVPEPEPVPAPPPEPTRLKRLSDSNSPEGNMLEGKNLKWFRQWWPDLGRGWRCHAFVGGYKKLSDTTSCVTVHNGTWGMLDETRLMTFRHDSIFVGKITFASSYPDWTERYSEWENDTTFVLRDSAHCQSETPDPDCLKYMGKWRIRSDGEIVRLD